ncbi:NADH-quinone oxidoreductase subunit L [Chlorella sorokiniana]|uniref:NADH-quinone oxidoreductase subunit L n=1 Tax=Chlorella sorokiniana TaxID=3076 RepID=A0A2P6U536_CHLSO|nr:NADH-quinone oxidoreductase subunit L [Chlorella sorokiniana]|eukprot:PRW61417.1 NADH-quinone oxidoreductase subunit L [Chlorella sorokiniana]
MQTTAALRAVQLPARSAVRSGCSSKRAAIRCFAQQRAQQQRPVAAEQQAAAEPAASATLALSCLLLAAPALAEEAATEAAVEAAEAGQSAGVTALGWALIVSPLVFYAVFNVYRSQVDPKAKFGDALFFFAASVIVGNIVSITVFKIRLF